jgi:hypothetical protein
MAIKASTSRAFRAATSGSCTRFIAISIAA